TVAAALGQRFPWLEEAYISAHAYVNGTDIKLRGDDTVIGRLHPNHASMIIGQYLTAVRGTGVGDEWVNLGNYIEHAEWLTPMTLARYLGPDLETYSIKRDPAADAVQMAKTLLRHESITTTRLQFLLSFLAPSRARESNEQERTTAASATPAECPAQWPE